MCAPLEKASAKTISFAGSLIQLTASLLSRVRRICRDSLLLKAVRRDEGLEAEVADPKEEVREGKAGEREGKDKLKSEGLQGR